MPRFPFAPSLAAAFVLVPLTLTGCADSSPYDEESVEATEGTAPLPDGAVNRSLDPGDAGTVSGPDTASSAELDGDATPEAGAMNAEPVSATPVSYEEFRTLIDEADGPVLVDCWADWCQPCREAFPHTVALAEKHADDGLTVISLAFNTEEEQAAVNEFLTEVGAGALTNVRTDDGGDSEPWEALGVSALPTLIVFDAEGNEAARIIGGGPDAEAELDAAVADSLEG
ncbi:TlpA family protein disulfide reductase [Alienimonas chondri]|uniref:Thiol-disulfide oxidoreductase ResA n=1 Tax=Alienimonas chondri TaxID=2681879 RepID=A0ABX1VLH3_9PLAN|nr:TlpA disulfide reductase family protein [Alienimonas chondri]NNJ27451.1 Thiol-disulfide oxidoreductase ResA [Alienimonas chondri]